MTPKTKYIIIIIISVIGFIFLIFNSIIWKYWNVEYFLITKVLYLIGLVSFLLFFLAKGWRKILTKMMLFTFSISLIINAYISYTYYERKKMIAIMTKYERANCDQLKKIFSTDLKNEEIKYFRYGMGTDIELYDYLKSKYGIESFGMGCLKTSTMDCYNELVNKYLIEKHNDSIVNGR